MKANRLLIDAFNLIALRQKHNDFRASDDKIDWNSNNVQFQNVDTSIGSRCIVCINITVQWIIHVDFNFSLWTFHFYLSFFFPSFIEMSVEGETGQQLQSSSSSLLFIKISDCSMLFNYWFFGGAGLQLSRKKLFLAECIQCKIFETNRFESFLRGS